MKTRAVQILILLLVAVSTGAHAQLSLISENTTWKYRDNGSNQGTNWKLPTFNDATWTAGTSPFGLESSVPYPYPYPILTPLTGGHITYYFRTTFNWNGNAAGVILVATNYIDDGAVFYLNGVEVGRLRLGFPVDFETLAQVQTNEGVAEVLIFDSTDIVSGPNVLAVEVHQTSPTSSDVFFGMTLHAFVLEITAQPQNQSVNVGSNTTFCVTATGMPPLRYQWQFNGTNISDATASCYTRTNVQVSDAGGYTVVVTNHSGLVTSSNATLSVIDPTHAVKWFTLDNGGGTSTGAVFAVRGTIGQFDAGRLANGSSTLNGGFWSGLGLVQMPGAPLLSILLTSSNSAMVSWPSPSIGFTLQQNTDSVASVNWNNILDGIQDNGTNKFIIVTPPAGNCFYRLFKP